MRPKLGDRLMDNTDNGVLGDGIGGRRPAAFDTRSTGGLDDRTAAALLDELARGMLVAEHDRGGE